MNKLKSWLKATYKSRTILFSRLLAILGIVQVKASLWLPYLGHYGGAVLFGVAIVMEILRWVTVKPVEDKKRLKE